MRLSMKHFLTLLTLALLTASCASELQENRESRSTVYRGQSTWGMYENFGAPTKAVRVSPNETHFLYRREEMTRDWTKMYFDWCDMVIVTVDDYVTDWDISGNQCHLNVGESADLPSTENERVNLLDRYRTSGSSLSEADQKPTTNSFEPEYSETLF